MALIEVLEFDSAEQFVGEGQDGLELLSLPRTEMLEREVPVYDMLMFSEQGPPGPPGQTGPAGAATLIETAAPISGHSAVACNASGLLIPADCTLLAHRGAVLGVTDSAYAAGADAEVKTEFMLEHAGWAWAPGPVFVGVAGALTQTLPPGAVFSQVVGQALAATQLLVDLQPPITLS